MSETDDQVTPCEHRRIVTFANPDASIRMWACEDCRRRFYPACYVCIDNGHRSGLHPDEAATPAALAATPAAEPGLGDIWLFDAIRECGGYIEADVARRLARKVAARLADGREGA